MNNDPRNIMPGDRVRVFDRRLFRDDRTTPLTVTRQEATVIRRYGSETKIKHLDIHWKYPDLVDVIFDHDGRESRGHFTNSAEWLAKGET